MSLLGVLSPSVARQSVLIRFISENSLSTFAFEIGMVNRSSTNTRTIFFAARIDDPSQDTQVGCSRRATEMFSVAKEIMPLAQ